MNRRELELVLEAQELVEAGAASWATGRPDAAVFWECPCGHEPPKFNQATPVRTLASLREPHCPFCGKAFKPEWRR